MCLKCAITKNNTLFWATLNVFPSTNSYLGPSTSDIHTLSVTSGCGFTLCCHVWYDIADLIVSKRSYCLGAEDTILAAKLGHAD